MLPRPKDRDPHAFQSANVQMRVVARDAHMRKARQIGVRNGHAVDSMGQMAKPGAEDEAQPDGGSSRAGLDGVEQISHRSVQR